MEYCCASDPVCLLLLCRIIKFGCIGFLCGIVLTLSWKVRKQEQHSYLFSFYVVEEFWCIYHNNALKFQHFEKATLRVLKKWVFYFYQKFQQLIISSNFQTIHLRVSKLNIHCKISTYICRIFLVNFEIRCWKNYFTLEYSIPKCSIEWVIIHSYTTHYYLFDVTALLNRHILTGHLP